MTLAVFKATLSAAGPPDGVGPPLVALWHDANGDWATAHETAQEIRDEVGAWVHAYLHRKEGDLSNAAYWYNRAGRPVAQGSLEAEWEGIVKTLIE